MTDVKMYGVMFDLKCYITILVLKYPNQFYYFKKSNIKSVTIINVVILHTPINDLLCWSVREHIQDNDELSPSSKPKP